MSYKEDLQNLILEIDQIIGIYSATKSAEFKIWNRKTTKFLKKLFGENSQEVENFEDTSFTAGIYGMDDDFERVDYDAYVRTLNHLKTTLQSYIMDTDDKDNANDTISKEFTPKTQDIMSKKIFIVHGHDNLMLSETENLLRKLGLEPIILKDQANGGLNTIVEKFEQNSDVRFAIVLFTSDDVGYKKGDETNAKTRARQNVVFELGYFAGKLGRKNVSIINDGVEELPSDIQGVVYTPNAADWKYKLAAELKQAGLDVDMNKI